MINRENHSNGLSVGNIDQHCWRTLYMFIWIKMPHTNLALEAYANKKNKNTSEPTAKALPQMVKCQVCKYNGNKWKFKGLHDEKEKICTALIHVNQMGITTYLGEHKASSEEMETDYVDRGLSKSIMEIVTIMIVSYPY